MKAIEILDKLMRAENWDDYYPSKNQCNEAIEELEKCAGIQFDADIVKICIENRSILDGI